MLEEEHKKVPDKRYDVIIPCYKPDEKCRKLLDALEQQDVPTGKIILINTEEKFFPKSLLE